MIAPKAMSPRANVRIEDVSPSSLMKPKKIMWAAASIAISGIAMQTIPKISRYGICREYKLD
jgi:hypothetical protein